jgi:carotenoid cleavage dioxygenase-like enzyme
VSRRVVDAQPQEFPRCDERLTGKPYRYAYCVQLKNDDAGEFVPDQVLLRHDLRDGTRQVHDIGAGRMLSEFVFQPRHAAAAEDEGWLMGYVVDEAQGTTEFVILDAQRFGAEPVAVVTLPHRIPLGFHGNWMPAAPGG